MIPNHAGAVFDLQRVQVYARFFVDYPALGPQPHTGTIAPWARTAALPPSGRTSRSYARQPAAVATGMQPEEESGGIGSDKCRSIKTKLQRPSDIAAVGTSNTVDGVKPSGIWP